MYSPQARHGSGLGIAPLVLALIAAGATIGGTALAARITAGAGPSQQEIEEQIRLQSQLEIERQVIAGEQTRQTAKLLLPAAGVLALVMLLR